MPSLTPDLERFLELARSHRVVPVCRRLLADRLTPVVAFELLDEGSHAFLLESVVGNEHIGRYSFIASQPHSVLSVKDGHARMETPSGVREFASTDPLASLGEMLPGGSCAPLPGLPPFTGGLVGYAAYDLIRYYEAQSLSKAPPDDRHLPDLVFGLYRNMVVFDHVDKTLRVVVNVDVSEGDPAALYRQACREVDQVVDRLSRIRDLHNIAIDVAGATRLEFQSNVTREQFCGAVESAKEYIRAGDIFQVVPSQRLRVQSPADPFLVYRALRVINPSPFMFFVRTPDCTLIGASPEILCRVQDGLVSSRPLAGTRRRGATDAEDKALEAELLADPKERAEHIMLVDLHRNDVGRVAEIGSVRVSDTMTVERYSHVMHITSHVSGRLRSGLTALDALRVSLPVGTVSGAPKIRAMQIIDELEPTRRGPYGGAVGYMDFGGNMDMAIALRTMVHRGDTFDIQAGCGVVADSVPEAEYQETLSKAKALLQAVEVAHSMPRPRH